MLAIILCIEKILTKHIKKLNLLFNLRGEEGEGFSKNGTKGVCLSRGLISGPCTCNEVFKVDLIIAIIA